MKYNQSGSVLAVSLVLLTTITLVAIMGMQRSGLQSRIVSSVQHQEFVFNSALSTIYANYDFFQTSDTQALNDAIEIAKNFKYQQSINNADMASIKEKQPLNLSVVTDPHITMSSSIRHIMNKNDLGNPNTSGLRNSFSRGKNGAGTVKFELNTLAELDSGTYSNQLLGFQLNTPDQ